LGKAWEAQLAMLAAGKKCWLDPWKNGYSRIRPEEVAGFLPPVQPPLETTPQPIVARALQVEELARAHALQVEELVTAHVLQVGTIQPPLGTAPRTMHIHPTCPTRVRGSGKNQVLWCNVHYIQVGVRKAKLAALQVVQLIGTKSATKGSTNQKAGAPPPPGFPHTMLNVERWKIICNWFSLESALPTARSRPTCR
jgi:hypothetical protein